MNRRTGWLVLGAAAAAGLWRGGRWLGARRGRAAPLAAAAPLPAPGDAEPLDVLIIGAGLSGIGAARHLIAKAPDQRFELLEARQAVGGTWDLFRYPGIRSDSDVFTLGYSFKPWQNRKSIADGPDIRDYIQEAADEAGITARIRFGHRVREAAWDSAQACWTVTAKAQDAQGGVRTVTRRARFLFLCSGYYSYEEGHRPDFPGEDAFRGTIVHPQFWPEDLDYAGKRVVIIGSGATAVTLVPALAAQAAHVTMLQRSPSDVAVRPLVDETALRLQRWLPPQAAHGLVRWKNILLSTLYYGVARRRPGEFRQKLLEAAQAHVGERFDARAFTPSYKPWDQRVCAAPDGDLFQAIREERASVVTGTIRQFTPGGVRLTSGEELSADLIVTATGLKLNVLGDVVFTVDGRPLDVSRTLVYKGMMLGGVPNFAYAFGYTNSSWTLKAELTADYVCRLLNLMKRRGYGRVVPQVPSSVEERPLLDFSSGYVARSADRLPKQGSRRPWQVPQNYLLDKYMVQFSPIEDGTLNFSGRQGTPAVR